jgi:thiol-disulfide isomerase/thioredoxin
MRIPFFVILLAAFTAQAQPRPATRPAAAPGCRIAFQVKPFKNQWLYVACYYGSIKTLADSVWLDANSNGLLQRTKPLEPGVYIVASPSKSILFEMLIDKDQQFSVVADSARIDQSLRFDGSADNTRFLAYTRFVSARAGQADSLKQLLPSLDSAAREAANERIRQLNGEILTYRRNQAKAYPGTMLALLFKAMEEVPLPPALRQPKSRADSMAQYRFAKDHYWDNFDFMDGRFVRTPIFEPRLTAYLENWVAPDADSVIYEYNWMMALGRNDPEMKRYLISYFVDHYMYPKLMGQDKVFLHVYETQLSGEKKVEWLSEKQMKTIRDRAYMLMANQLGAKAWDLELVDTANQVKTLYQEKGTFTVVLFWDVHCGKCREEMPKLDTLYNTSWKDLGVKIYAVMVNESGLNDWTGFINQWGKGWTHVHQPAALREAEEKAGKPNFRQLYDMRSTPTFFLLDADKKIIAKNLSLTDLNKLILLKSGAQPASVP